MTFFQWAMTPEGADYISRGFLVAILIACALTVLGIPRS
jgi:hypothetical protein